jgi:hypothetical protein
MEGKLGQDRQLGSLPACLDQQVPETLRGTAVEDLRDERQGEAVLHGDARRKV